MTGRRERAGAIVAAMGVVIAVVVHGVVLYHAASRVRLPVVIASGVAAIVVVKHLGLVGRVRGLLRRGRDEDDGR